MEKLYNNLIDNFQNLKYALLNAQTFNEEHYGFPPLYYKIMETDEVRVNTYKRAFAHFNNFKGKVICEAGVGTLTLSKYFLPYVKKAYLIENNPDLTDFIKKELTKNGWADKVEFIVGDAMKVHLPEKVDFVIGELMSIYCANEYQVQIFKHLRKFLKPDGHLIPEKIINMVQLGNAKFENGYTHYPINFTRHRPELLTSQEVLNTINLYKASRFNIKKITSLKPHLSGTANCIYMNSWIQLTKGINFTGTDSLMPPTVKLLEEPIDLKAGSRVKLHSNFTYGTDLDVAKFTARQT